MALDLVSLLDSIENLLKKNNTITSDYDISDRLNKRVQKFLSGVRGLHEHSPVPTELYPCVFVELGNKSEEYERISSSNRRDVDISIDIVPITQYGAASSTETESRENANKECIMLSQNIEELIRNKITLSSTVSWVLSSTDYNAQSNDEATYNAVSRISLNIKKLKVT